MHRFVTVASLAAIAFAFVVPTPEVEAAQADLKTFKSARFDDFPDSVDAAFSRVNRVLATLDRTPTD
ncbi:MAG: hypothetical protein AAF543_24615 [Pseudomonadota bacterium]